MNAWIKMGVAAGALALAAGCQERSTGQQSQVDQQGWAKPGEGPGAAPVEGVQGNAPQDNNTAQGGYGGSGDTNLNTDQPINQTGPGSAMQPTPDGFGEDTASNDRSTQGNTGATSGTSMGTTGQQTGVGGVGGGTGGSGDEGTTDETMQQDSQAMPDTSDEPRPDEGAGNPDPYQQGTGGAGTEMEDRSEGNTGTEQLQPGETDAKTGMTGTGGAGAAGGATDAGTASDFDSADGVSPESDTTP